MGLAGVNDSYLGEISEQSHTWINDIFLFLFYNQLDAPVYQIYLF